LASASYDDTIKIWTLEDGDYYCKHTLEGHSSTVWGLTFSTDGTYMISCSEDKTVKCWSAKNRSITDGYECGLTITGLFERAIYSVDYKEQLIAAAGGDDSLCLFCLKVGNSE